MKISARAMIGLGLIALLAGGIFLAWQKLRAPAADPSLLSGNGRLEATEVDIATKITGRLASLTVHEGDPVAAGEIVARLDTSELEAQKREADAGIAQAREAIAGARALVEVAEANRHLAELNLKRTEQLVARDFLSAARRDSDRASVQTFSAARSVATQKVREAEAALSAAQARAARLAITLEDCALKSPIAGRVLYRLAEPGEVLSAAGKALTVLDLSDVFMNIYLPNDAAGKVALGAPARIALDALPDQAIPAHVSYVAPRAQFTPREVETRSEREKLMFRVKLSADPTWLARHRALAKPGVPGVAWIQTDPSRPIPSHLSPR